ncbi:MAG TPA: enoyl-CoA hydratase-related protein [Pyrinomonadaceae bacterium]|nr:enoyl-CoA hydratase-related protein [Pyrinomonadaceae bacterium]
MLELLIDTKGSVRILTLNRPVKRNALNDALVVALKSALRDADDDESLRSIVIRGAGKDFCSGADLESLRKISESSYEENLQDARSLAELFALIRRVRIPVIAAVHGRALAGGCGLAMACDLIISDTTGVFGFPEVKIGFVPAIVAAIVRRNMSEKDAFAMLTLGDEMMAVELGSNGLVHGVFDDETFEEDTIRFAEQYALVSGSAVEMTKKLLYEIDTMSFEEAIERGAQVNAEARMSEDCKKGIARFLEKK